MSPAPIDRNLIDERRARSREAWAVIVELCDLLPDDKVGALVRAVRQAEDAAVEFGTNERPMWQKRTAELDRLAAGEVPERIGDEDDIEAGRCCPHCHQLLTEHNRSVWEAGYAMGQRHAEPEKWWVADGNLADGARKIIGPFGSRDLALNVRRLYEFSPEARGRTFWVSQEGTGWAS